MSGASKTRIWFDTEFIENGRTIDLISIGLVREDGAEYYAQNHDVDLNRASDWVKTNVIPHLLHVGAWKPRSTIAQEIREFVGPAPEFWGYYADYDWVVLCQLYGRMIDLPAGWPMFCLDIKQQAYLKGDPPLPKQDSSEHHALNDARWARLAWESLQ